MNSKSHLRCRELKKEGNNRLYSGGAGGVGVKYTAWRVSSEKEQKGMHSKTVGKKGNGGRYRYTRS